MGISEEEIKCQVLSRTPLISRVFTISSTIISPYPLHEIPGRMMWAGPSFFERASNRCYCAQDRNSQLPTLNVPAAWCHASQTWWTLIPLEPKFWHVLGTVFLHECVVTKSRSPHCFAIAPVRVSPQDLLGTCVLLFCYWPHWGSVLLPLI